MKSNAEIVSLEVPDFDTIGLQQEVTRLRRQIEGLTHLLRLGIVILQASGFSFARVRPVEGSDRKR
ncbi:MAG: hypothetical protein VB858_14235 [Planctomycetaceae bacterium]